MKHLSSTGYMWKKYFKKIGEFGFKLSMDKCKFYMSKIKYLAQIIDAKVRRPDIERSSMILNMPAPTNITSQAFLGLANYHQVYLICTICVAHKMNYWKEREELDWKMPGSFPRNKIRANIRTILYTFWPKGRVTSYECCKQCWYWYCSFTKRQIRPQRPLCMQVED